MSRSFRHLPVAIVVVMVVMVVAVVDLVVAVTMVVVVVVLEHVPILAYDAVDLAYGCVQAEHYRVAPFLE